MIGKKIKWPSTIAFIILLIFASINLFPFFNLLLNSFRYHSEIVRLPLAFDRFTLGNYVTAQEHANLFRGLFNGIYISFCTIIVLMLLSTMNSYALTFIDNKYTNLIVIFLTFGYFIPPASLIINTFLTLRNLSLLNTYTGIILVFVALYIPISMILLMGHMKTIPRAIIESAKIDGANHYITCWKIILPLTKPMLVTLTILMLLWTYRDYMWPLILMARPEKRTIAVSLSMFVSDRQDDLGVMSAAVMVSLIPIMGTYIILKDKIMAGMAAGSVKG